MVIILHKVVYTMVIRVISITMVLIRKNKHWLS